MTLNKLRLPYRDDLFFSILMLAVLVTPLAFTWQTYEKFETIKIALLLMLTGWAFIVLAAQARKGKTLSLSRAAGWSALALSLWILAAVLHAPNILNGLVGTYPRFTSSALFYVLILGFFLLLLASLTREKFIFLLHLLCFDALAVALVGMLQSVGVAYYTGLNAPVLQRGPSLLGNPDFSAMFVVALLPVALYFLLTVKNFWQKVYYLVALFCMVCSILLFASRGAWLAGAVGLLALAACYAIFRLPKKFAVAACLLLLVSAGLWYASFRQLNPASLSQTFSLTESNEDLRFSAWDMARQAMLQQPLLGVGPGNFQYFFQSHRGKDLASQSGVFDDVHNLFLQLGATLGIPFLLAILIILVCVCLSGFKQSWRSRDPLLLTVVVSLFTFCLAACFNPVASACFVLAAVLVAGLVWPNTKQRSVIWSWPAWAGAGLAGIVLFLLGAAFLASELLLYRGITEYDLNNYQSSYKLTTVAGDINPTDQLIFAYKTASGFWLGKPAPALEKQINQFINIYPLDQRGYTAGSNIYALLYEKTGNTQYLDDAVGLQKRLLALDPNNANLIVGLGLFYYFDNNDPAAFNATQYALTLDSSIVPAWLLLARLLQLQNNVSGSKNAISHAYRLQPSIGLLQELYLQSRQIPAGDYSKLNIPVLYNPNQIE